MHSFSFPLTVIFSFLKAITVALAISNVEFDTDAAPAAVSHGGNKAQRDALADDALVKVRDQVVKSNPDAKLTKGLQVSACVTVDTKNPNNFFNFISDWESVALDFETHFRTFCVETPFALFTETTGSHSLQGAFARLLFEIDGTFDLKLGSKIGTLTTVFSLCLSPEETRRSFIS